MLFGFGLKNKTVKELRKNKGYTADELARRLRIDSIEIKRVDYLKLKDVPKPLYSKLLPIFRGDDYDKIPW
ncbi:MAG: transcriptional regulator [Bacillota bacterium]|nr:transcriptional regulator [Clostridia bacterium]